MKFILPLSFLALALGGCNAANIIPMSQLAPSPESTQIEITATTATIKHQNRSASRQTHNKVAVSIEPVPFSVSKWNKFYLDQQPTLFVVNGQYNYIQKKVPILRATSERVQFRIKVSNNSHRVLRLGNSVVTFEIDGAQVSVAGDHYSDFTGIMITPGSTKEVVVSGPKLSEIQDSEGVIRLGIYEIMVGEKPSNYEWFFTYNKEEIKKTAEMTVSSVQMTTYEARSLHGSITKAE